MFRSKFALIGGQQVFREKRHIQKTSGADRGTGENIYSENYKVTYYGKESEINTFIASLTIVSTYDNGYLSSYPVKKKNQGVFSKISKIFPDIRKTRPPRLPCMAELKTVNHIKTLNQKALFFSFFPCILGILWYIIGFCVL